MSYNIPVNGNLDFSVSTEVNLANLVVGNQTANNVDSLSKLYTIIFYYPNANNPPTVLDDVASPDIISGPPSYYQCNGATVSTNFVKNFILPNIPATSIVISAPGVTPVETININYYMYLGKYLEIVQTP
jgi:hypothetical protein